MSAGAHIQFLGAAETVTGSKFLVTANGARILVECGLFQGLKNLRLRNWTHLPFAPDSIDAVVLTHAHLDHSGYVPLLVRNGFHGDVFCTPATRRLCEIVLPDSGKLQEEEAGYAERHGYSKHHPARPLYTESDARASLRSLRPIPFGEETVLTPGVAVVFHPAGHILGSATATLTVNGRSLLFSGDLGRETHPLLLPPRAPAHADVVIVESTYGDRVHEGEGWIDGFAAAIHRTASRNGKILIPAFAVDRTEEILFHLGRLMDAGDIPQLPVFVDSPMALEALKVYRHAIAAHDPDLRTDLSPAALDTGALIEARTVQESIAINSARGPAIIVSAAGMATGGRVLHHLARLLPDPRTTVILPGYQAVGTRGRAISTGARSVKLLGRTIDVRAEVMTLDALSSHADRDEIVSWLGGMKDAPAATFIVHGEPDASSSLAASLREKLSWNVSIPRHFERVAI